MQRIWLLLKRRWKWTLLLLVVLSGIAFWFYRQNNSETETLTFVKAERGALIKTLEVSGSVTAKEYARLRFAAGGKVVYLGAKEGDNVKKGQTIASIDQATLKKSLEQDLNSYEKERLDWDQTLDDTKDRWIPKSEDRAKQKSQIDLEDTVIDVEITDIAIKNTRLSSPLTGVLVSSPTQITGVNLLATDIFEIVNPDTLIFQALVNEEDMSLIQKGQIAEIILDAYPDDTISSQIEYISYKSAQSSTGTVFLVEFPILQPDINRFRLGMNGDAVIKLEEKENVISIPLDATIERDGKVYVQVRTGEETSEEKEITVGLETDDRVEVTQGLEENEEIVLPE